MTKEHQEEINERLQEINRLLEYYNPYEKYIRIAIYIACTIGFIALIFAIKGWAMLIYCVVILGLEAISRGKKRNELTEVEIKKTVQNHIRIIMSIVREDEHPEIPKQRVYSSSLGESELSFVAMCGSDSLYDAFVKLFPSMDTYKLRSFAKPKRKFF